MRFAPRASKAAKAAVIGVVQATPGRAALILSNTASSPITIDAEVQLVSDHVEMHTGQDDLRPILDQFFHLFQRFRRNRGGIGNAASRSKQRLAA